MILTEIRVCGELRNLKFRRDKSSCPIVALKRVPMREEDVTIFKLWKEVKKTTHKAQARYTWISEATWRLSDRRTDLRQNHPVEQQCTQTAYRRFKDALQEDRRWRVSMMGANIEALIKSGHMREA